MSDIIEPPVCCGKPMDVWIAGGGIWRCRQCGAEVDRVDALEAEIERLRPLAELGELMEQLPDDSRWRIDHAPHEADVCVCSIYGGSPVFENPRGTGEIPAEAIRAALVEADTATPPRKSTGFQKK